LHIRLPSLTLELRARRLLRRRRRRAAPLRSARPLFAPAPAAIELELIATLFSTTSSIVILGASVCLIGLLLVTATGDVALAALCALILAATVGRVALVHAYRRRRASGDALRNARRWQGFYAAGSYGISLVIGAFNFRALMLQDPIVNMLVVGTLFGYSSGLVTRLAVRPRLCGVSMALTAAPTALGLFLYVQPGAALSQAAAAVALSLIVIIFGFVGLQMMRYSYASTLGQMLARRDLSRVVRRDALTGLPNRILLRERFEREVEALGRNHTLLALHYLDLDRFKAVNDTHGHQVGDALLMLVSERLEATIRIGDTAARLSGDEFVIVQPGIQSAQEAEGLATRLLEALRKPYVVGDAILSIGATFGIALAPEDGCDLDQLSARADAALYQAKRDGGGRIAFWNSTVAEAA